MADQNSSIINPVCDEFDNAWAEGNRPDITDYLKNQSEEIRGRLANELLRIDIEYRRKASEQVLQNDYEHLGEIAVAEAGRIIQSLRDQPTLAGSDEDRPTILHHRDQIGSYRLIEKIGEGGMGTVWLAEQQGEIHRRVALKVIRSDMGSQEAIARFEAERQALTMMQNEHIAKVLDAGTAPDGTPYFVMELVENGIPITEYCDQNRLNVRQRLKLMEKVCRAVQHAHNKGIIHRDLKPSNVLIGESDGVAVPKIIDFGLAKALDQGIRLTDKTLNTAFGRIVGTLQYMAPEQAEFNSLNVDTRSDIYSLGVMTYELLTGSTPLADESMGLELLKTLELIRERDPRLPSIKLSSSRNALASIGESRNVKPSQLKRMLQGELDWIVMKSLEKRGDDRYGTATAMADDISAYLAGDVVTAGPRSAAYKIKKFVSIHRGFVASLATIFFILAGGIVATSIQAVRAKEAETRITKEKEISDELRIAESAARKKTAEEKVKAETARDDALASAKRSQAILRLVIRSFKSANPFKGGKKNMSAKDVLLETRDSVEAFLREDPLGQGDIYYALASSFHGLGEYDEAAACSKLSLAIRVEELGREHVESVKAGNLLSVIHGDMDEYSEALAIQKKSLEISTKTFGPTDGRTLSLMNNMALSYRRLGRTQEALELYRKTLRLRQEIFGESHEATITTLNGLAGALKDAGLHDEATEAYEKSYFLRRDTLGPNHLSTALSMGNLAQSYRRGNNLQKAIDLQEESLEIRLGKLNKDHPDVLNSKNNLAMAYEDIGRIEDALAMFEEVLDERKRILGESHASTLISMGNLGDAYSGQKRYDEAIKLLERRVELTIENNGEGHPMSLVAINNAATNLYKMKRFDEAHKYFQKSLTLRRETLTDTHTDTLISFSNMAAVQIAMGKYQEAISNLEKAVEGRVKTLGMLDRDTISSTKGLMRLYCRLKRFDEVKLLTGRLLNAMEEKGRAKRSELMLVLIYMANAQIGLGEFNSGIKTLNRALNMPDIKTLEKNRCNNLLALALTESGDHEKSAKLAEDSCRNVLKNLPKGSAYLDWVHPRVIERTIKTLEIAGKTERVEYWKKELAKLSEEKNKIP